MTPGREPHSCFIYLTLGGFLKYDLLNTPKSICL